MNPGKLAAIYGNGTDNKGKKKKYKVSCAAAIPAISASFAAIIAEGKTVRELETLGLFLNALANDLFMIAALRSKLDIFEEEDTLL